MVSGSAFLHLFNLIFEHTFYLVVHGLLAGFTEMYSDNK